MVKLIISRVILVLLLKEDMYLEQLDVIQSFLDDDLEKKNT